MKYYWSCWFTKDELIDSGAEGIIPTFYGWHSLDPNGRHKQHWVFKADPSFPVFANIKFNRSVAEIPKSYHNRFVKGETIIISAKTRVSARLLLCDMDF